MRPGCQDCGKVAYPSRREARQAAKAWPGVKSRAYQCAAGWWHLTTVSARKTAAIRSRRHRRAA